jgi:hypothetical protein
MSKNCRGVVTDAEWIRKNDLARRRALQWVCVLLGTAAAGVPSRTTEAHEGHDHAPRTILDLKGKLVRIIGPNDVVSDMFIEDRVTIRVNAEGRIVDLTYG